MFKRMMIAVAVAVAALAWISPAQAADAAACASFRVEFSREAFQRPYSGRIYIALSSRAREPRLDMGDWVAGPQVVSMDVVDAQPGDLLDVAAGAQTFRAKSFAEIPKGTYYAQAVARVDPDSPSPGRGEGDVCSGVVKVEFDPKGTDGIATLTLSKKIEREKVRETDTIKVVEIRSEKLSAFHGRDVPMRAGVLLPPGWKMDAAEKYPVVYFITGFGGGHDFIRAVAGIIGRGKNNGVVFVVPDPLCFTGHSVFADSANNGPWGGALVHELIPTVEQRFHCGGSGTNRYVTGVSSGGWSSLWLQVAYPEEFNGCWSHCPDPVDFRDFQQIDLYTAGANLYTDEKGQRRPISRGFGGVPHLYFDEFVRQETVMGAGGQIGSFEAVFSPRGADGRPMPLFDRATGAVDPAVARSWEAYDIRLKIEREWKDRGPKVRGKIHVYAGENDSFYLEGAARLLKDSLEKLGSDAQVVIVPKMVHTIYTKGVVEMLEAVRPKEQ